jgi:uncharacterized protein (DUF1684 family)
MQISLSRFRVLLLLLASVVLSVSDRLMAVPPAKSSGSTPPDYAAERADRARGLTQPYGWLSLVALNQIHPGLNTVGSDKGNTIVLAGTPSHLLTFELKDGLVKLASADSRVSYHGHLVGGSAPNLLISADERDESALAYGTLRLWVIDRSGSRYLRVKDSEAPTLKHFHGLNWYEPDAHYRVQARWVPDAGGHVMSVPNKIGQVSSVTVPGHVEFELNGAHYSLVPLNVSATSLWFVFRDETYHQTTDQGGRFLYTDGPSNGLDKPGEVTIDFNEAVNPPCAYSPYATCPLAAKENRLAVAIRAGEKRYEE